MTPNFLTKNGKATLRLTAQTDTEKVILSYFLNNGCVANAISAAVVEIEGTTNNETNGNRCFIDDIKIYEITTA